MDQLSADPTEPTAEQRESARALYRARSSASPWRKLDPDGEMARQYRMACAITADQSNELEALIQPAADPSAIPTDKPMVATPVRNLLRKLLLGHDMPLEVWLRPLTFYPDRNLVEFRFALARGTLAMRFVCVEPSAWRSAGLVAVPLSGKSSEPIHRVNSYLWRQSQDQGRSKNQGGFFDPKKEDGSIEDYLRFFCEHISGYDGFFHVLEYAEDIGVFDRGDAFKGDSIYKDGHEVRLVWLDEAASGRYGMPREPASAGKLRSLLEPLTRLDANRFLCSISYAGVLFRAFLHLDERGMVEMEDDQPLFDGRTLPLKPVRDLAQIQEVLKSVTVQHP